MIDRLRCCGEAVTLGAIAVTLINPSLGLIATSLISPSLDPIAISLISRPWVSAKHLVFRSEFNALEMHAAVIKKKRAKRRT